MRRILLADPGREVCFCLIDLAGPCRTGVHVHRNLHIIAILLHCRQIADFLQAGLVGLACRHAAVDRDRAAVRDSAAARGGIEDLGNRAGSSSEESCIFIILRIVFRVKHLGQTADHGAFGAVVVVQGPDVVYDVRHLVDGVVAALRSGAVAGNSLHIDADLHASALSSVDTAVRRFRGDDKLRSDLVLVDDVLPAQSVAVLLHDGADNHDLVSLRDQIQVFHDLRAVERGGHAAFLIGSASSVDDVICLISLVRIVRPVVPVADADGVDMTVDCNNLLVIADISVSAHPADDVAQSVDLNLVEPDLLHLCLDAGDDFLLLRALARVGNHRPEKPRKVAAVSFCCLFDLFVIETHVHTLHKTICVHPHSPAPSCAMGVLRH